MDYCVNDISWLQKSISSMEERGLARKGAVVATEIVLPNGNKAVRLKIDGETADFPNPIEATNYIVEHNKAVARKALITGSMITGAVIGGAAAVFGRNRVIFGASIGMTLSLLAGYYFTERLKG
jgi:hypothetical protein